MDFVKHAISRLKVIALLLAICTQVFLTLGHAQCEDKNADGLTWDFDEGENKSFSIGTFLSDKLTPQIILDTKRIRDYIRDGRFQILRGRCGDMRTIDAIYIKALKIADYNISRALFISFMAVLEHRSVGVKVPILKSVQLPLSFEEDTLFWARIKNLPTHVYPDSPTDSSGDIDKLQHFFGSAYLAITSESPGLTRTAGNIIEWGEEKFVVGGADDPRDKRANNQGKSFGRDLLIVKTLLPSDYLTFQNEGRK